MTLTRRTFCRSVVALVGLKYAPTSVEQFSVPMDFARWALPTAIPMTDGTSYWAHLIDSRIEDQIIKNDYWQQTMERLDREGTTA